MVSVIVPTYNVEKYIDRCLASIINQTYKDFEIIVVDGHSKDETLNIVKTWVDRDKRISVILQRSKGLGPARDEGVAVATGEFITFIDSDDWWDPHFIEKMIQSMADENIDISMCDRLNYHFADDGRIIDKYPMTKPLMFDGATNFYENNELLTMIEVSVNGKLFRRDFYQKCNITTPPSAAEDRAVMHYLTFKARKIAKVREYLYFYHANRNGSLIGNLLNWKTIPLCLEVQQGLFSDEEKSNKTLTGILRQISLDTALDAINAIKRMINDNNHSEADEIIDLIKQSHLTRYPDVFKKQYIIGSYSIRREIWLAYHTFDEIRVHQQYSSIISLVSLPMKQDDFEGISNSNQREWIKNDFNKSFLEKMQISAEDYLFIDFLEERFDIGKKGDAFFTWSPIYDSCELRDQNVVRIDRMSNEADDLFYTACDKFIDIILNKISADHIVLVKNHLCENHGMYRGTSLFFNSDWVRRMNEKIDKYYDYFISKCPDVIVITPNEDQSFFSYERFPFGCAPYHVNDGFYHNVAYKIRNHILE